MTTFVGLPKGVCGIIDEFATGWEPIPTAKLMKEPRFDRVGIMCPRLVITFLNPCPFDIGYRVFYNRQIRFFPASTMTIQNRGERETGQEVRTRLANEIEQDRIAKALEPVVAEYHMMKLPEMLQDMIEGYMESDIEYYYQDERDYEREQYERALLDCGDQIWAVEEMAERRAEELRRERETEREREIERGLW